MQSSKIIANILLKLICSQNFSSMIFTIFVYFLDRYQKNVISTSITAEFKESILYEFKQCKINKQFIKCFCCDMEKTFEPEVILTLIRQSQALG